MDWKRITLIYLPSILGLVILALLMFTDVVSKMTIEMQIMSYGMIPFGVLASVFLSSIKD